MLNNAIITLFFLNEINETQHFVRYVRCLSSLLGDLKI